MQVKAIMLGATLSLAPGLIHAQFDFPLAGRDVQVHSFASQGFTYSNNNNYLTMDTSRGSLAMTDFGANVGTQLSEKLHVGAQIYDRNLGRLGNWRPEVDWAFADYRFKDWFGIRGGKVKTVVGLYNDIQDMEFLHTWALMPQSVYPADVRGDSIAHLGGDIYGNVAIKKLGAFSYTLWGGKRLNDPEGGYLYGLSTSSRVANPDGTFGYTTSATKNITYYGGPAYGADLRWQTPVPGLLVGASYMRQNITTNGQYIKPTTIPYRMITLRDPSDAFYYEYTLGNLKLAGEYRRELRYSRNNLPTGALIGGGGDARSGFVSATYRISRLLELGSYHSRFILDWVANHGNPKNHVFDQVVAARVDISRYVDFKVEGHFIDGSAITSVLNRGFYAAPNPAGLKPTMNMLVLRLGYHF